MRQLCVCYRTAWLIKHKLLEVMWQREEDRQLTGRIEMDDAYLGGERHGGTAGRGSENKVSFVAAVQTTESGRPHLICFSKRAFTKESLREFMSTSIALPATAVSDGLNCFTVARELGMAYDRSRADFESMCSAMTLHRIKPVVDRVFARHCIGRAMTQQSSLRRRPWTRAFS